MPDGTVKWIHERGRYILDKSGNPVIFEGTSQDITERLKYINAIETQNQKLKDISWIQSHVVRAPIARLMSLIDLIQNHHSPDEEMQQLLQHVLQSAHDLDNVLREISKNAEQIDIVWDRRI